MDRVAVVSLLELESSWVYPKIANITLYHLAWDVFFCSLLYMPMRMPIHVYVRMFFLRFFLVGSSESPSSVFLFVCFSIYFFVRAFQSNALTL